MSDGFFPLRDEWVRPRVAILDDSKQDVYSLIKNLETARYRVDWFSRFSDLNDAIRTKTYPIQLIDIQLSTGEPNGFEAVHVLATLQPEALRICISKLLHLIPLRTIVDGLNPRPEVTSPLSLSSCLGIRDFWGIYDKSNDNQKLREIVVDFRSRMGCGDQVSIEVDQDLLQDFETNFESVGWGELAGSSDIPLQFVEIVRQLARRPQMPPVKRVRLTKLGKGRSRTIVAHMQVQFQPPGGYYQTEMGESVSIIKIGRARSIEVEVTNFSKVLPSLFGSVFYPSIEATGVSRELGGVAYSCLSNSDAKVAPTLLDALFGKVAGVGWEQATAALKKSLDGESPKQPRLASTTERGAHLLSVYEQRFSRLKPPRSNGNGPVTFASDAAVGPLEECLGTALEWLKDCGVISAGLGGEDVVRLGEDVYRMFRSVAKLTQSYCLTEDFYLDLCHGDLHLDNILLVRQGDAWTNFYIDFAEAGEHHAMLDIVVMEVALRFQAIKFLPGQPGEDAQRQIMRQIVALEEALIKERPDWEPAPGAVDEPTSEWLKTTWKILSQIRAQGRQYLQARIGPVIEEDESRRAGQPPAPEAVEIKSELERHRYYCGIGLAGLPAMLLPQPEGLVPLHRAWFCLIGQVYVTLFNLWKSAHDD